MDENKCPECGAKMISRRNSQTGQMFWGCSKYPECRGTRDTMGRSKEQRHDAADERQYKRRWDR